jgi:hypothetical protein
MDQRRGLERVPARLDGQPSCGELTELVIHEGKKISGSARITGRYAID